MRLKSIPVSDSSEGEGDGLPQADTAINSKRIRKDTNMLFILPMKGNREYKKMSIRADIEISTL